MLDISIKSVESVFSTPAQLLKLMTDNVTIDHKTDGVKLTLVKVNDEGGVNDWIVSYKGQIFYPGEFDYQTERGKTLTMGNSQFDAVFKHLEKLGKTPIKTNMEFFIEFVMRKGTLMSNYAKTGNMVLIGYDEANPTTRYGKIDTGSGEFCRDLRDSYAKILKISTPHRLFEGKMYPYNELIKGIKDSNLANIISKNKAFLMSNEQNVVSYYQALSNILLTVESVFGGSEEGVVIETSNCKLYKIQQTYQLDKIARAERRQQLMEPDENAESAYWNKVHRIAVEIVSNIKTQDIQQGLNEIALAIRRLHTEFMHSKKNGATVKDDIQSNAKTLYLKKLNGNNGSLVLGKFRVLTNGHVAMIRRAMEESDDVVIGLVTSTKNEKYLDLRKRMLQSTFPTLKIIELKTGNLFTAFKKAGININNVYAGTDRVQDYLRILKKTIGVNVIEMRRGSKDISATKVLDNIASCEYFKSNTPSSIHRYYDEIKMMCAVEGNDE